MPAKDLLTAEAEVVPESPGEAVARHTAKRRRNPSTLLGVGSAGVAPWLSAYLKGAAWHAMRCASSPCCICWVCW